MHQLTLVEYKEGDILKSKTYRGYGQILKISYDGCEKIISVEPEDVSYGVFVDHLEFGNPYFRFNSIPSDRIDITTKNIEEAKKFCKEFYETKDELLKF